MPFFFFACINVTNKEAVNVIHFDSGFSLCQDTIFVDIKGEMTHAFKYNDKFYILFQQRILKYGGYEKRWLYVFSNGEIEKIIDCPKKMDCVYLDFYVKNDSIILKPYMDKQCYYLDVQNYTWKELEETDDLIFEDEKFHVYSLDFGEWGGKTWFKDKKTGIEYLIESTTPLINKIDTTYYLTSSHQVLKIENPLQLNKCDDDVSYKNIRENGKYYSWYGESIGFDVVYKDTTYNYFDFSYHPRIVSSFVLEKELLHIYETDSATYVAKIENGSMKIIQEIGGKLDFYNWHYSYRCKNLNGNNELLKFYTKDEQLFGLMEVVDNNVFVHYFSNKAELSPKPQGSEKADSIFVNRFNLILSNLGNLQLKRIALEENKWKSFDITPNHKVSISESYYPNFNKYEIDDRKSYLIEEDSLVENSISYYATKENDLIRVAFFEWEEAGLIKPNLQKKVDEIFRIKLKFLEDNIAQKAGNPIKSKEEKNYVDRIWNTSNGFTITLENMKNFNRIRLIIYKE